MNARRILPALIIAVTLGIGIFIGTVISPGVRAARSSAVAPGARPLSAPSPVESPSSFAQIADLVRPSVVNVSTESTVRVARRRFPTPDDSPFNDFFDRFFQAPEGPFRDYPQNTLGSGVILDKSGYILTNHHVVTQRGEDKPVDRISVLLHGDDGTKYKARIIGSDVWTDLAVIKIDAGTPLTPAQFGDSDSVRVGDWVLAVGSPFGWEGTVTAGIISAKGRDVELGTQGQFKRYIQTDAAINPGNSGGPLVNLAGQVIGINTAIETRRGTYDGVGFAIPSDTARKVYNALITTGSVRRGAIGVRFYGESNPSLLRSFGTDHGVVINIVEPDSPAARAGLKRGDVILSVDGKGIRSGDELVAIVSESEIGRKLKIEYLRDGTRLTTVVEVGDRSKLVGEVRGGPTSEGEGVPGEGSGGVLGVTVKNLTREQAQELADQLHLESRPGVLVTDVLPGGFASDLLVQRGDVILSINHRPVTTVDDFSRLQSQLKSGNDVLLLIARRSSPRAWTTMFLADRLP
jgi:serine protease Do